MVAELRLVSRISKVDYRNIVLSKAVQQTTAIAVNRAYTIHANSNWLKGVIYFFPQYYCLYYIFDEKHKRFLAKTLKNLNPNF